jgi:hypothetical protein
MVEMKKLFPIFIFLLLGACTASNRYVHIIPTEAQMVQDCQYLETFADNSDPGRVLPKYRFNDAELTVLHRADRLGATHVVWVYNFPRMGSAAEVYHCDD